MRFLVIGASGRTGQIVLDEAIDRGHTVIALVRNPTALPVRNGLMVVKGTPSNKQDVEKAMSHGADAVIVTLNAPRETDSPFSKPIAPPRFMADAVANVREAMKAAGVRKLVVMSAFGVGESFKNLNFLMKPVISHTNMAAQFKDHNLVYKETKEWDLEWVFARPAMLKEGGPLPVKEFGKAGDGTSFMPSISRGSVARFLVEAAEGDRWNRSAVVICN